MLSDVLEGTWEEVRAHDSELTGRRVRLEILPQAVQPPTPQPDQAALDALRQSEELQKDMQPKSSLTAQSSAPQPNAAMLHAMQEVENIQKDMSFVSGFDSVSIIREGRAGAMYGDCDK